MPRGRRSFSPEYRVEAAHRVIDGNRRVADVARELDLHENLLHKWVADERRRMAAAGGSGGPDPGGGAPLSANERAELVRLRAQVVEQSKDIALLEKASAYFAAQHRRSAGMSSSLRSAPATTSPTSPAAKGTCSCVRSATSTPGGHWAGACALDRQVAILRPRGGRRPGRGKRIGRLLTRQRLAGKVSPSVVCLK